MRSSTVHVPEPELPELTCHWMPDDLALPSGSWSPTDC